MYSDTDLANNKLTYNTVTSPKIDKTGKFHFTFEIFPLFRSKLCKPIRFKVLFSPVNGHLFYFFPPKFYSVSLAANLGKTRPLKTYLTNVEIARGQKFWVVSMTSFLG